MKMGLCKNCKRGFELHNVDITPNADRLHYVSEADGLTSAMYVCPTTQQPQDMSQEKYREYWTAYFNPGMGMLDAGMILADLHRALGSTPLHGELRRIADLFGKAAYIDSTGTVRNDPLPTKVLELVRTQMVSRQELKTYPMPAGFLARIGSEMPKDTVIENPEWWAKKLWRHAMTLLYEDTNAAK